MKTEQKVFTEYWTEDFSTRNIDPIPASLMPKVRDAIIEEVGRLIWISDWLIDDLERKLHRLEVGDPLLDRAATAIAAERTARATEGPTERAGRRAMLDIYALSTTELADQLDPIRARLAALGPGSPVRAAGERALSGRENMLEQVRDRIARGDNPWTKPELGQPLKVGDGFTLNDNGERLHYAITLASPGKNGQPNSLLAALGNIFAEAEAVEPTAVAENRSVQETQRAPPKAEDE